MRFDERRDNIDPEIGNSSAPDYLFANVEVSAPEIGNGLDAVRFDKFADVVTIL
ncbi:MAG TPA: hypothetical protein VFP59_14000 [Candidatus Angelobacter sp.]|nr:hypothetical protein [Candidatus Angelobacter sp.]